MSVALTPALGAESPATSLLAALWESAPLDVLLSAADAEIVSFDFDDEKVVGYAVERKDGHVALVLSAAQEEWMREQTARDLLARMRGVVLPGQRPALAA